MDSSFYYKIVYAGGDQNTLTVVTLQNGMRYEETEYVIASRREFGNKAVADEYCRQLAVKYGKQVKGLRPPLLD